MSNSWFPVTRYYRTGGSKLRSNVQYTLHLDAVWQELVVSCLFCILHSAIFVILNSPPHAASIPQYWFPTWPPWVHSLLSTKLEEKKTWGEKCVNSAIAHLSSVFCLLFYFVLLGPYPTLGIDGTCGLEWGRLKKNIAQARNNEQRRHLCPRKGSLQGWTPHSFAIFAQT